MCTCQEVDIIRTWLFVNITSFVSEVSVAAAQK